MRKQLFAILILACSCALAQPLAFETVNWSLSGTASTTTPSRITITAFSPAIPYVVFIYVTSGSIRVTPSGRCGASDIITQNNSAVCRVNIGTSLTLVLTASSASVQASGTYVVDKM